MFGFSKKDSKEERKNQPEYLALVEKWDTFLAKMETRFNESLVHALQVNSIWNLRRNWKKKLEFFLFRIKLSISQSIWLRTV